jgi:hypothetical protein
VLEGLFAAVIVLGEEEVLLFSSSNMPTPGLTSKVNCALL